MLGMLVIVKSLLVSVPVSGVSDKVMLAANYSRDSLPPTAEDAPVLLLASVNLRNILDVVETKQQIRLEVTLRYFWKDTRIKPLKEHLKGHDKSGSYVNLHQSMADKIWMPDAFIDQAINLRQPKYFYEPSSLRVYNDSTVRYSKRVNFDIACQMKFHKFPKDEQICIIKFESFSYSTDQMNMKWLDESLSQVNPDIHLDQFYHKVEFHDNYSTDGYDISYPGLIMKIHLKRNIGYQVMQTFVPSSLFVTLGYLSLYIPPESIPGRVAIGMTTILTLTAMFSGVRHTVPKVSYISFLDIWMVICLLYVCFFMFEFILVVYLKSIKKEEASKYVEKKCRVVFPLTFLIFNVLYWPGIHHL